MIASGAPLWLTALAFIAALGPLVFFHELGHYFVGRLFGVGAETFSIGFGRELIGWTDRRGTRWKIAALPLGGYVRFVGDMNPASAPANPEDVPQELRSRSFHCKPVWQRFLVVLAGPAANFILATLIFVAFFTMVGTPVTNVIGEVSPGSAAQTAGIRPGDRILSIAGRPTPTYGDIFNTVALRPGESVAISVQRNGAVRTVQVQLGTDVMKDGANQFKRGLLGVRPSAQANRTVSLAQAVPMAAATTVRITGAIIDGLAQLVRGKVSAKQLGGPLKIAQVAGDGASQGLAPFLFFVALISINLGFINLLPVPMLDGGHLLFYGIEAVRRRPVDPKTLDWAFRGGLAALLALFVFTTVNDLGSFGLWERLGRLIG